MADGFGWILCKLYCNKFKEGNCSMAMIIRLIAVDKGTNFLCFCARFLFLLRNSGNGIVARTRKRYVGDACHLRDLIGSIGECVIGCKGNHFL